MNNQGFGLCPLLQNEVTKRTMNKIENTERYVKVYEAMKQAIPDDNNMLEVLRAAEIIIADCIFQSRVSKEIEERTYKAIPDDIKKMVETFKDSNEESKEGESMTTNFIN